MFCVNLYCGRSLEKQSSGVQEQINLFYIEFYGENGFSLRTFWYMNEFQE